MLERAGAGNRERGTGKIDALLYPAGMTRACGKLRTIWRMVAAALLLIVFLHAATPLAEPLARTSGSAFSAATGDVSLKSGGNQAVARQALRIEPSAPLPWPPPPLVRADGRTGGAAFPEARGPPAAVTVFAPLSPRAPPAA